MSRSILFVLVCLCYLLFSTASIAQSVGGTPATGSADNNLGQKPQYKTQSPARGAVDARVSVARLSVPWKARRLYEKALGAWQQQKPAEAQRKVEQALKLYPAFPEALTLNGFIQASQQQWEPAEKSLQAAIRSDPNYCAAYIILAGVYNTEGRYDEAQAAADRAASAGVDSWSVQYEIARVLIGKGEYEDALAIADKALRSKHGSLLHVAKAHALLGLRRYPEAATELRNYLRYEPGGEGAQDAHDILGRIQGFALRSGANTLHDLPFPPFQIIQDVTVMPWNCWLPSSVLHKGLQIVSSDPAKLHAESVIRHGRGSQNRESRLVQLSMQPEGTIAVFGWVPEILGDKNDSKSVYVSNCAGGAGAVPAGSKRG